MRGGSHGNWNRFLCSQILGAERDTVLPGGRHPVRFVFQSDQDYSGRDAPWRRCCCGGMRAFCPRTAHCARRAWNPAWRLLARSARGPAARSRPGGSGGLLLALGARGPTARSKPSGNASAWWGPEIPWPKGAPLSPTRFERSQRGRRNGPVGGQEGWRWHVLASSSCRYPTGSGPMPAVWCCGWTTAGRPPSYIYLGKCLAGCCYLSFSGPAGTSSTWLKAIISEVGPVDGFSNLGKFRATWSQKRGVACLYLVPMT